MTSSFCQPPLDQKPTITICPSIPFNFLSNNWYQHNTVTQTRFVSKLFFLALLSSSSSWHFSILRLKKNFSQEETNLSFRSSAEAKSAAYRWSGHHRPSYSILLYILVQTPFLIRASDSVKPWLILLSSSWNHPRPSDILSWSHPSSHRRRPETTDILYWSSLTPSR